MSDHIKLLIIDLEATCDANDRITRSEMETIEIGATLLDLTSSKQVETFQTYIKPVVNPILTIFCTELTGIQQSDVDDAPYFFESTINLTSWIESQHPLTTWASWGAYDRGQFTQDCSRHGQSKPLEKLQYINLKTAYAAALNTRSKGLANAFTEQGQKMIGRHHSGLDDAINTARLIQLTPIFTEYLNAMTLRMT